MRVIVFFDLPTLTANDRRAYTQFRKFLIHSGFIMLQESVYAKLALNQTAATNVCAALKMHRPTDGLVQVLTITEKQFQRMEYITGEFESDTVVSDERVVII